MCWKHKGIQIVSNYTIYYSLGKWHANISRQILIDHIECSKNKYMFLKKINFIFKCVIVYSILSYAFCLLLYIQIIWKLLYEKVFVRQTRINSSWHTKHISSHYVFLLLMQQKKHQICNIIVYSYFIFKIFN